MNLDPVSPEERHALYDALFAAMGLPPRGEHVSRKYYIYGERALVSYRKSIAVIANVVARYAAEDAK